MNVRILCLMTVAAVFQQSIFSMHPTPGTADQSGASGTSTAAFTVVGYDPHFQPVTDDRGLDRSLPSTVSDVASDVSAEVPYRGGEIVPITHNIGAEALMRYSAYDGVPALYHALEQRCSSDVFHELFLVYHCDPTMIYAGHNFLQWAISFHRLDLLPLFLGFDQNSLYRLLHERSEGACCTLCFAIKMANVGAVAFLFNHNLICFNQFLRPVDVALRCLFQGETQDETGEMLSRRYIIVRMLHR